MPAPIDAPHGRSLSIPMYLALLVVYLCVVQGVGIAAQAGTDAEYGTFRDTDEVLRFLWLPVGISAAFAAALVTWLRWWRPVLVDDLPVRRWVWFVPIAMIVAVLAGTDYGALGDRGTVFTLTFIAGALLVGFAEETMFRGVGVTAFRANGFEERRVALWVAVLFGLAHGTNLFAEGPSAFAQVLVTAAAGFYFYLVRRVAGAIWLAMVLHGLWDFGLFTGHVTDDLYAGALVFIAADVVIGLTLLVRRRHIGVGDHGPDVRRPQPVGT